MPLSDDPDKRARQLANLKPRPVPAPYGARRHGGYSTVTAERLAPRTREIFDALALDAPLRDQGGELPAADAGIVTLLAQALCRLEDVTGYIEETGWLDQKTGEPRTAVLEIERRLQSMAAGLMDKLGMTPASRARLGLDLARTIDAAKVMSEPDPEKRRLMIEGGQDGR